MTIREFADERGLSTSTVRQRMDQLGMQKEYNERGATLITDEQVKEFIKVFGEMYNFE